MASSQRAEQLQASGEELFLAAMQERRDAAEAARSNRGSMTTQPTEFSAQVAQELVEFLNTGEVSETLKWLISLIPSTVVTDFTDANGDAVITTGARASKGKTRDGVRHVHENIVNIDFEAVPGAGKVSLFLTIAQSFRRSG